MPFIKIHSGDKKEPQILYSYCVLHDNGSAPNPFWGVCTLAICKPKIRKAAKIGDWIVGTGSSKFDFQNQLIYAMKVTDKMTFEGYNNFCIKKKPEKIPLGFTRDLKKRVGDCLYDYSNGKVIMRDWGVHQLNEMRADLGGEYVLLSNHFYYFGSRPMPLPNFLLKIVKQGKGHKSKANSPYIEKFIQWIITLKKMKNKVNAIPYGIKLLKRKNANLIDKQCHLETDN